MMTLPARFLGLLSVLVMLVFGASACEDDDNPLGDGDDEVAQVIIEFDDDTLTVGGTIQLTVTVIDEEGDTLSAQTVTFTSSDTAVASVSGSGLVEALTAGSATITATVDDVSDTITIVVEEDSTAANVTLDPGDTNLAVGDTLTFTGTVTTAGGDTLSGETVTFSSTETAVATVDPATGLVTAVAVGRTNLVATSGALADTVEVSVGTIPGGNVGTLTLTPATLTLAVAASDTLAVAVTDTLGAAIVDPLVDFSTTAAAVATVDAFGVVTGVAAGTANIVATFGAASDTTAVTVQ
ncbi:MAG TPA: Ig-like domain-containing protein [Gemmatimonadota bacterium]|nr:Ig-like domain-containing protein [Gemmatimonadota bacterium]